MTEIPKIPPCYLTIHQSENCSWADHTSCNSSTPLPHLAFENASQKPIQESESFEYELPCSPCVAFAIHFLCSNLRHLGLFGFTMPLGHMNLGSVTPRRTLNALPYLCPKVLAFVLCELFYFSGSEGKACKSAEVILDSLKASLRCIQIYANRVHNGVIKIKSSSLK